MRDQKNDEKGYFFSRRAVRSADIIKGRQNVVFVEKGYVFTILLKRCEKGWTEASLADMFWAEMTKMSKT